MPDDEQVEQFDEQEDQLEDHGMIEEPDRNILESRQPDAQNSPDDD